MQADFSWCYGLAVAQSVAEGDPRAAIIDVRARQANPWAERIDTDGPEPRARRPPSFRVD